MLGCEAIVGRHDDRLGRVRDLAEDRIELLHAADRPAAAVQIDDDRKVGLRRRAVDANRHAVGVAIFDGEDGFGRTRKQQQRAESLPYQLERLVRPRRKLGRVHRVAQHLGLRMQRHQASVPNASRNARTETSHAC